MSEEEQVKALLGKRKSPAGGSGESPEQRCAELERQLQSAKVEQGRVKALDARVKELEQECARLRGERGAADVAAALTPEERGDLPEDYIGAAAKMTSRAVGQALTGVNEELARMRREREAEREAEEGRRKSDFIRRVNARFPGFLGSISEGGDKAQAWASFLVNNADSVSSAFARCDLDSLVYHVERFYREVLDVRPPDGERGAATAPDPVPRGSGKPAERDGGSERAYTPEEYDALDEKCMKLRREGRIDEYRKLRDELDSALSEGRVRQ